MFNLRDRLAVYVPGSSEQRIGSLVFFGLILAIGSYVAGYISSVLLMGGSKLYRMIAARCFRYFACLLKRLLVWFGRQVSGVRIGCLMPLPHCRLQKSLDLSQQACRSIRYRAWRTYTVFIEYLCSCWAAVVHRNGWGLQPLIRIGMLLTAFGLGWCGWLLEFKRPDPAGGAAIES